MRKKSRESGQAANLDSDSPEQWLRDPGFRFHLRCLRLTESTSNGPVEKRIFPAPKAAAGKGRSPIRPRLGRGLEAKLRRARCYGNAMGSSCRGVHHANRAGIGASRPTCPVAADLAGIRLVRSCNRADDLLTMARRWIARAARVGADGYTIWLPVRADHTLGAGRGAERNTLGDAIDHLARSAHVWTLGHALASAVAGQAWIRLLAGHTLMANHGPGRIEERKTLHTRAAVDGSALASGRVALRARVSTLGHALAVFTHGTRIGQGRSCN